MKRMTHQLATQTPKFQAWYQRWIQKLNSPLHKEELLRSAVKGFTDRTRHLTGTGNPLLTEDDDGNQLDIHQYINYYIKRDNSPEYQAIYIEAEIEKIIDRYYSKFISNKQCRETLEFKEWSKKFDEDNTTPEAIKRWQATAESSYEWNFKADKYSSPDKTYPIQVINTKVCFSKDEYIKEFLKEVLGPTRKNKLSQHLIRKIRLELMEELLKKHNL